MLKVMRISFTALSPMRPSIVMPQKENTSDNFVEAVYRGDAQSPEFAHGFVIGRVPGKAEYVSAA